MAVTPLTLWLANVVPMATGAGFGDLREGLAWGLLLGATAVAVVGWRRRFALARLTRELEANLAARNAETETLRNKVRELEDGRRASAEAAMGALEQRVSERTEALAAAEQKQRELAEALQRLSAEQAAILDGTGQMIGTCDRQGIFRMWNRAAFETLGWKRDEVIGTKTPALILVPEEVAAAAAQLSRELGRPVPPAEFLFEQVARREPFAWECTFVRKDGSRLPVALSVSALRSPQGEIVGLVGSAVDLTSQRGAAEELRASRERLATIFGTVAEGLVLKDANLRVLECNAAAERILGLTREQLSGRASLNPWWRAVHEDGTPFPTEQHPITTTLRTGQPQRGVIMGVHKPGGIITWITVNSEPVRDEQGRVRYVACSFVDITGRRNQEQELRRSEQRLLQAQRVARVGCWHFEIATRETAAWWSAEMFRIFGLPPSSEPVSHARYSALVHPADRERMRRVMDTAIARRSHFVHDYRIVRPDGTERYLHEEAEPMLDADGKLVAMFGATQDITERKRLEENLARARDAAVEASRMKSEFLANVSHEIRTPMNGIIGMTSLMMETELTIEQRDMGRVVQNSAENLLGVVNDILDFSKVEAGKLRLEPADFELQVVIDEILALLSPRAQEKNLDLACEFDPQLAVPLHGDAGRIRQVVLNLVANAVKFTARGRVTVSSRAMRVCAQSVRVRVSVSDTGFGISPEARAHLFEPFVQLDNSDGRRYGGTGLGLAISRQLVELMGGTIGLESVVGQGSTFWFEIDLARPASAAPLSAAETAAIETIPPGMRVLIVDDTAENRQVLLAQLGRVGIEASAVADGFAALAQLRTSMLAGTPWHVVLLDWQMDGMSGLQLAIEIRADELLARTPLVMLSSAGGVDDIGTATAVGFEAFLTKPVREAQLLRCLARLGRAIPVPPIALAAELARTTPAAEQAKRLRLLLAEDNPANQTVAVMLLTKMGHSVDIAQNGREALKRLAEQTYDAVLMDCQMPVLDGYEATRRIRAGVEPGVNPRLPIIALTAYAMADDRQRCLDSGMDDYVSKPVRAHDLREALTRCGLN